MLSSLRARIALFFVALLVLVQGVTAVLVTRANAQIARETIEQDLAQGERIFQRLLAQSRARLEQGAAILSADFAFRQAIATDNTATIVSALRNHGARVGANVMMLVALDGLVRADTQDGGRVGKPFAFPVLVRQAASADQASAIVLLGGKLHQLVVVPLLAPEAIAWVGLAFAVDDAVARELNQLTGLEVSFLSRAPGGDWMLHASTLAPGLRTDLRAALAGAAADGAGARELHLGKEPYEVRLSALAATADTQVAAALIRPLAQGLRPFQRIDNVFLGLAVASIALLIAGSIAIARSITRPVQRLSEAARRIQQGDYDKPAEVLSQDEIGGLAKSFNTMLEGIKSREREILRLAYEDGLTALPNRAMFQEQLEQAVRRAQRSSEPLAVMLLDMDRFKTINDTLGHPVGDLALREVAQRVRGALRASDVVARLGGDEFAVLLATGEAERGPAAAKILKALEAPLVIDGQKMDITVSIGIASFPEHGGDAAALMRAADIAMYAAKRGKSGFATYDPGHDERRQEHLTLLGDLRRAVEGDELVLHYQPKVSLGGGAVGSVEALVRWKHPARGMIPPDKFIPFAEQTGYISEITRWVMRRAIAQCAQWSRAGLQLRVTVNVSARDLRSELLVKTVEEALAANELPAALLCLEITESGLMDDPRNAQSILRRLRDLGVSTSIDDYGTGYSSLAYIKQLPVSELKIDKAFVSGMEADRRNAAIVRSTIELGHNLGLTVVAEGVETEHEAEVLRQFGCDLAQGYHFARPLPAEELFLWIASRRK